MSLSQTASSYAPSKSASDRRLPRRVTWALAAGLSLGLWGAIGLGVVSIVRAIHG